MAHSSNFNDTQLSKRLTWLLRHGAHKEEIPIRPDGYIFINTISSHPKYRQYTLDIITRLVQNDAKHRYTLKFCPEFNQFAIKANQGHSMTSVEADHCLKPIESAKEVPIAVHGTYYRCWPKIKQEGLRCMGRNQIHFAVGDKPTAGTSGFRENCQLLIYLNVAKAINRGRMRLYRSDNNVILTSGNDGSISKEYFDKVIDRKSSVELKF